MTAEDKGSDGVKIERQGPVAVVLIDNPPLNLLTQDIRRVLGDAFAELSEDDDVRAVIFGPGPKHFCAGADMKEFPLRFDPEVARQHGLNGQRMIMTVVRCRKPVIFAIEGACMGGGLELALAGDVRIAASSARLGLPEIQRGAWPGTGGMFLLARLIGDHAAKRVVMDGGIRNADEALDLGLVDDVVDDGKALEAALAMSRALAEQPALSLRTIKTLMDHDFIEAFAAYFEKELEAYVACYRNNDVREGNRAFFEKREPKWTHS